MTNGPVLQRKCSCGDSATGGECAKCRQDQSTLQRAANTLHAANAGDDKAFASIDDVLRSPGQSLDAATRAFMEPRFGRDFSRVQIHTDARAAQSAQSIDALAYTVGQDIVFGQERYRPSTPTGRHLLAHELTHVVQQGGTGSFLSAAGMSLDSPGSPAEREADGIAANVARGGSAAAALAGRAPFSRPAPIVSRRDTQAVETNMNLGRTPRTGLQFLPVNVTDTRVGPVSVAGGLQIAGANRLHVIVGENLTPRTLARQLLTLWVAATPFTPTGAAAPLPLDIITEDELAQGCWSTTRLT